MVYVNGLATFCFDAGDEVGRRLAAVQLVRDRDRSALAGRVRVRGHPRHAVAVADSAVHDLTLTVPLKPLFSQAVR